MSDAEAAFAGLIARVRAGDDDALAELVRRYEPKVRLVARGLLGPALRRHLDSVDVAQSVHLVLVDGLRGGRFRFAGEDAFLALAVALVRRKVARTWRRFRTEARLASADPPGDGPPAPAADPAAGVLADEALARVWPGLTPAERQLVQLRLQGCSTAEAAEEMGVAANVLRVLLSRLRARLREGGALDDWL